MRLKSLKSRQLRPRVQSSSQTRDRARGWGPPCKLAADTGSLKSSQNKMESLGFLPRRSGSLVTTNTTTTTHITSFVLRPSFHSLTSCVCQPSSSYRISTTPSHPLWDPKVRVSSPLLPAPPPHHHDVYVMRFIAGTSHRGFLYSLPLMIKLLNILHISERRFPNWQLATHFH